MSRGLVKETREKKKKGTFMEAQEAGKLKGNSLCSFQCLPNREGGQVEKKRSSQGGESRTSSEERGGNYQKF